MPHALLCNTLKCNVDILYSVCPSAAIVSRYQKALCTHRFVTGLHRDICWNCRVYGPAVLEIRLDAFAASVKSFHSPTADICLPCKSSRHAMPQMPKLFSFCRNFTP